MSSCHCPSTTLAAVSFDNGAVLLRCTAHEQQRWLVEGREVPSTDALAVLRDAFVAGRSRRPEPGTRRHKVVRLPDTTAVEPYPETPKATGDASADLTALLNARGLTGSWAVA